jgi:hypothetical protein
VRRLAAAMLRSHGERESSQARRSAFEIKSGPGAFRGEVRWIAAETSAVETDWLIKIRPCRLAGAGGGVAFGVIFIIIIIIIRLS